jgi:glycosyltransferase involved in cell wall biosynthesis
MWRVMIVTNSLSGGGAERSMNLLANELTKRGWPVSLVPINSSAPDQVVPVCPVFPMDRIWNGSFINTVVAFWNFKKVVHSWKPDIIVLNCDLPELFGCLLPGTHKLVAVEHSSQPWGQRKHLGKIVRRILRSRKARWAAVSTHLNIWPLNDKPNAVLQNSILLPQECNSRVADSAIKRLVFIGRLSQEKRPDLALEIAKLTNLELIIIGDGLLKKELEKKAQHELVQASFLGWVEDPWREIQAGDLLVVTSSFEGDGLIVIEGLAHGIPMLLSDILDLRRFNFPDRNYGKDLKGFVALCEKFRYKLHDLCVPDEISNNILDSRSIEIVSTAWENFLKKR